MGTSPVTKIIHSAECKYRWREEISGPGPTVNAWHYTCTQDCHVHEVEELTPERTAVLEERENAASDVLDRAFGDPPSHR